MKLNQGSTNRTGTNFTSDSTNHNSNPNGETPVLMSEAGRKLAAKTAPPSGFVVKEKTNGKA
jgi:hypothetical protein